MPSGWIAGASIATSGVGERRRDLVLDDDRVARTTRGVGMVGADRRDRLAGIAHDVFDEHRLVAVLQAVAVAPYEIGGGEHRVHTRDCERGTDVDAAHDRRRVR